MTGSLLTPRTVEELIAARRDNPRARLIAGGTDVVADLNRGIPAEKLISLRAVAELGGVQNGDDRFRLGAMSTIADVRANAVVAPPNSALGQATRSLGSRQIRNRATVGGNICGGGAQRTLIPVLLAYDATVDVVGSQGARRVALADVIAPEGTRLAADEILTAVRFTQTSGPQRFYRVGPRNAACYATASVAVVVDEEARSVRVALGGVGATAVRAPAAEIVADEGIDWHAREVDDQLAADFGAAAAEAAEPLSDVVASAEYRRHAVTVMARRALKHIFEEDRL